MNEDASTQPDSRSPEQIEVDEQQRQWRAGWAELRAMVQRDGGYPPNETIDEIVEQMRKTRYEIYMREYDHLYREEPS